ncbi:MAG: oligosaccharide flippase family protein, partial [Candidatus Roizmanbacteria bacterium]
IYLNISYAIKLCALIALWYLNLITVTSVIFVFCFVGPIMFILLCCIGYIPLIRSFFKARLQTKYIRFKYTSTYFLASQFFQLASRMDLFIISYYLTRVEVGYYTLAQKIILTVVSTIISVTQVLSPSFAKIKTKLDTIKEFRHGFIYLLLPALLFLAVSFTPDFVFKILFPQFLPATQLTRMMALPFIIYSLGNLPLLYILYTMQKPSYLLISNICYFLIMTIGCYVAVPLYGIYAPIYVNGIGLLISVSYLSFVTYKKIYTN